MLTVTYDKAQDSNIKSTNIREKNMFTLGYRHTVRIIIATLLFLFAFSPNIVVAESHNIEPAAKSLFKEMSHFLASKKQFSVHTDNSMEVVYLTGQKIQYNYAVKLLLSRPNKLRAERLGEDLDQVFYYDGKSLSLHSPVENYFATMAAPATVEEMLDFARESLDIVAPAGDLVYSNSYELLMEDVISGFVVGKSTISGVRCTHLAFRNNDVDWQIWIQDGEQPIPRKMVITTTDVLDAPQFTVEMSQWDFAPNVDNKNFVFSPSDDMHQIEFISISDTKE